MTRAKLSRIHLFLIALVAIAGATIAGIGFLGSYTAVRQLAVEQGFGSFSKIFPIGVDLGIIALLALDLLLSWLRIPFFLLRQTAWLLTAATIAWNAASAWPHPLGVGMHAVIPVLFIVIAEAARHAISRLAKLTDTRHMESVRLMRWVLSPIPTFAMWRRMKLWEIRSVDEAVRLEQMRLAYGMLLEDAFGKDWAKTAPRSAVLPLRLAKLGVPIYSTASQGLAAAGLSDSAFGGLFTSPELEVGQSAGRGAVESHTSAVPPHALDRSRSTLVPAQGEPARVAGLDESSSPDNSNPGSDVTEGLMLAELDRAADTELSKAVADSPLEPSPGSEAATLEEPTAVSVPLSEETQSREDQLYGYYRHYVEQRGQLPEKHLFADFIYREFGQTGQSGAGPVSVQSLRRYWGNLETRYQEERGTSRHLEDVTT
ncbi:hypothetical protein GCM10010441_07870 [Kitasatospora paracochleata]|uniref:DUF2637 domain-containing protein n=1 Tax=Kitasatospora paracochleata TaxID=58354 RepID=A0ABT1J9L6_9ACTN|nr:hypothetical protein [Kitasatospora paracochleata]